MRTPDVIVIFVYLIAIVWAGLASRGKKEDVNDYFTAKGGFGGRLGVILVGLSIAATLFSGISFVVYTSTAFSAGSQIMLGITGIPISYVVLRFWFLPRFLSAGVNHPYDIIEAQLGRNVRLTASAMFVLLRLGWMSVMITAPTLVIMGAGDLGPEWFWPIVGVIGVSCTLYTAIGGIRGVIVTDAIQFLVMAAGILFVIGFILSQLAMPVTTIVAELQDAGRLQFFDLSLDPSKTFTLWSVMIGLTIANLGNYMADLMMLQRYLAAGSARSSARSFLVNMWGVIGVVVSLVIVGLLLWVWYRHHPDPNLPTKADKVLPYFIARELPAGMSGLLIASILAATMSSMTSGIIALGSTLTNDWLARLGRTRTPAELFRFGRGVSVVVGVLATVLAGFSSDLGTLFQTSQIVLGAFNGPMLACMIIVIARWKFHPIAVLVGMALGTLTGCVVAYSPIAVTWLAMCSAAVALAVPALHRMVFPVRTNPGDAAATPSKTHAPH